ncbi:MAG TPA: N-acetylglucosamine-6-phosphate deacetylase [Bryobacterales bacterium]|nr:N-acetylglucosamine-6-phosphate deacetylase [Bryobacterales bacterium]
MRTAFLASTVYTPDPIPGGVLLVEDGRIAAVGTREQVSIPKGAQVVQLGEASIAPGFIDIHVHGAGGRDLMEPVREAADTVSRALARHGTTSYYATTVTAPAADTLQTLEFLAGYIAEREGANVPAAQPLGIHMEGPYISVKRRGVHPVESIAEPTLEGYRRMAKAANGTLRIMTIAPELAAAPELIAEMVRSGVRPSIGHTDATCEQAERAVELGARQATHTFNAMRPFAHRDPGVIGAVLTDPRIKAELIADGVHVDPTAIRVLYQAKGASGIILVSDGVSGTGMPDGLYPVAGFLVEVKGGVCRYQDALAGSVLTLDRAVRNMRQFLGLSLAQALPMATLNPAELLGIADRKGALKPGADADLVVLDTEGTVQGTYVRGVAVTANGRK